MMNVGLYNRGVDAKSLALFHTQVHRCLHHQFIDGTQRLRRQSVKGAVERIMLWHRLAVEIRKLAQRVSIRDPFAQFTIRPVLDPHQDQGTQNLLRCQSATTSPGIFQASFQIVPYGLNHLFVVVQKIADALQQRFQRDALLQQLPIGETDLRLRSPGRLQSSVFFEAWSLSSFRLGDFATQPDTAVPARPARCPTSAELGEPIPRGRTGKAASLLAAIEDITGMLLPGKTRKAIRADAGTAAKTERAEGGGPQVGGLLLQPALDVGKGFGFRFRIWSTYLYVCYNTYIRVKGKYKRNSTREIAGQPVFMRGFEFRARN